jgi:hypothetical protein
MSIYKELRSIDFDSITNGFVQYFKETGQIRDKTLAVPFEISVSDYKNDITKYTTLTFLFHSPSNYTKVAVTDKNRFDLSDGSVIEFLVDHDSCWRDGISRKLNTFINDFIEELEESDMTEFNVSTSIGFGIKLLDFKIIGSYDDELVMLKK